MSTQRKLKISEVLKIAMQYYWPSTGNPRHSTCMCWAIADAMDSGKISHQQADVASEFCMQHIKQINNRYIFLYSVLVNGHNISLSVERFELVLIYERLIEWLEDNPEHNTES